jgi:hypothetical protein
LILVEPVWKKNKGEELFFADSAPGPHCFIQGIEQVVKILGCISGECAGGF